MIVYTPSIKYGPFSIISWLYRTTLTYNNYFVGIDLCIADSNEANLVNKGIRMPATILVFYR